MDSWNVFFEGSENARNPSERLTGGPIAFGDRVLPRLDVTRPVAVGSP